MLLKRKAPFLSFFFKFQLYDEVNVMYPSAVNICPNVPAYTLTLWMELLKTFTVKIHFSVSCFCLFICFWYAPTGGLSHTIHRVFRHLKQVFLLRIIKGILIFLFNTLEYYIMYDCPVFAPSRWYCCIILIQVYCIYPGHLVSNY